MKTCKICGGEGKVIVSDCCGANPFSNGDASTLDYGICPECREHCIYEEVECEYCKGSGEVEDEKHT